MGARIKKIAVALPKNKVTNADIAVDLEGWDPERFAKKTGIVSRFIAADNETALDLAEKACRKLSPEELASIDLIVFCTETPDHLLPHNSALLHARLGMAHHVGAFDINLGCSGYVYSLIVCKGLIACHAARTIALITSDTYSKCLDPHDRATRPVFGDAATVTLITETDHDFIKNAILGTDGTQADALIAKGTAIQGMSHHALPPYVFMDGAAIFSFMLKEVPPLIDATLGKNGLEKSNIDMFVFHQANAYMLEHVRKAINVDTNIFFNDCAEVGNTISSSIPLALSTLIEKNLVSPHDTLLLSGFGVGLSWAAIVVEL